MLLPYLTYTPTLVPPFDLAPSAAVVGRVTAGPGLVMRGYATLRADGEAIRIGAHAFFAERATVHIVDAVLPAIIGDDATVGRYALVHACTLGDGVVVGAAAVVMDGADVGSRSLIAPGALVAPRKRLPGGGLYAGSPAVRVRDVGTAELAAAAASIRSDAPVADATLPALTNRAYAPPGAAGDGRFAIGGRLPAVAPRRVLFPVRLLLAARAVGAIAGGVRHRSLSTHFSTSGRCGSIRQSFVQLFVLQFVKGRTSVARSGVGVCPGSSAGRSRRNH